jgi:hypothetical protein
MYKLGPGHILIWVVTNFRDTKFLLYFVNISRKFRKNFAKLSITVMKFRELSCRKNFLTTLILSDRCCSVKQTENKKIIQKFYLQILSHHCFCLFLRDRITLLFISADCDALSLSMLLQLMLSVTQMLLSSPMLVLSAVVVVFTLLSLCSLSLSFCFRCDS